MKILMVGPDRKAKGGMATVISNFKQYNNDQSIFFLTTWTEKQKLLSGVQAFFKLRHLIKQENIDIVHFHVAQRGSFYRKVLLAWLTPKKCRKLFHMHASQFDTFYEEAPFFMKKWISMSLNKLDALVVLSKEWEQYYQKITDTKTIIIENAVSMPKKNNYQNEQKHIITLGKLGKRKGTYDILKVAERLEISFPDVTFTLYGDGETEEVSRKIIEMNLKNVRLGGWLANEEKQEVLSSTILHLLPSYQEGLPMAILETMAAGIPNLSTTVGGIPTVIQNGENGILIAPGNVEDMERELRRFLLDKDRRQIYSKNARRTIKNRFSIESYLARWQDLYIELMKR